MVFGVRNRERQWNRERMRPGTQRKKQRKRQNGKHCIDWAPYIVFFFFPFFRFGYEMLLLIEFFCWIGLDLICFCFGFLDSLSKCFFVKFINMQKLSTVFCFLKLLTVEFSLLRRLRFFFDPFWKNRRLYSLSLMLSSQIIISGSYKNKIVGSVIVFSIVWRGLRKSIGVGEMERHLRPTPLSDSNHQKICIPQLAVHYYRVSFLFLLFFFLIIHF